MIQSTVCPRCGGNVYPSPFVGSTMCQCPHCTGVLVLSTDGLSFETSRIRATLPVNGEAHELVPGPDPRLV